MIRVLHLIEALGTGGAERRLINDLRHLDREEFSNVVCCLSPRVEMWDDSFTAIPLYLLDALTLPGIIKNIGAVNKIIRKHNIDIVHTQLFWADLIGRACKFYSGRFRLISTIQSTAHDNNDPYLYSYKRKVLDGITGRLFNDGFIAVSAYVKKVCVDKVKFPSEKICIIPNSVDFSNGNFISPPSGLRKQLGLRREQKTLITVGRIDPPKGHIYLVRALLQIKKSIPDIKLIVVGDGPGRQALSFECANLGLGANVLFTGKRNDVKELLSISDIFIFPTLSEGFSLALLEAMSMRLPCVATSIGPNAEVITDMQNGLLVGVKNPAEIARAVLCLFENPDEMKRIAQEGFLSVKNKFSAQKCARELGGYYLRIFGSGARQDL